MDVYGRSRSQLGTTPNQFLAISPTVWLSAPAGTAFICIQGTFQERVEGDERVRNTTVVFDPNGEIVGHYRKIHMFDVTIARRGLCRNRPLLAPGEEIVTFIAGRGDSRSGHMLRRALPRTIPNPCAQGSGDDPAAGRLHADDARSLGSAIRVVRSKIRFTWSPATSTDQTWAPGNSQLWSFDLVDPWGTLVVATAPDGDTVINGCHRPRGHRPVIRQPDSLAGQRQPEAYRWPDEVWPALGLSELSRWPRSNR